MIERRGSWIALWGIGVLLLWGTTSLLGGGVTAPTAVFSGFIRNPLIEAMVYLFAAGLAIAGYRIGLNERHAVWLSIPALLLLWTAGESSLMSIVRSSYPDGTVRPMIFILRDQAPMVLGELAYSCILFPLPSTDRQHVALNIRRAARAADRFGQKLMRVEA